MRQDIHRVAVLIMDSVGIGAQDDACDYDSFGANTFLHAVEAVPGLSLPSLERLGFGNIEGVSGIHGCDNPISAYGRMIEITAGNDTYAGVWEMAGVVFKERATSFYPEIPRDLMIGLWDFLGRKTLCNAYVSGFRVLDRFLDMHRETHDPIVYTSDDGVILVAAHEQYLLPEELHQIASKMAIFFAGRQVTRVIARPFVGDKGNITRTSNRRDFVVPLDKGATHMFRRLREANVSLTVTEHLSRMIGEEYATTVIPGIKDSLDVMESITAWLDSRTSGVSMFVLPDFDMSGHRRDPVGYASDLTCFDVQLGDLLRHMGESDIIFVTADHGCDPTFSIRGHTREYVPILAIDHDRATGCCIGTRSTFADLGQTICDLFGAEKIPIGTSFATELRGRR